MAKENSSAWKCGCDIGNGDDQDPTIFSKNAVYPRRWALQRSDNAGLMGRHVRGAMCSYKFSPWRPKKGAGNMSLFSRVCSLDF